MKFPILALAMLLLAPATPAATFPTEANVPVEISFTSARVHADPFLAITLDVTFTDPAGNRRVVPAFWDGGQNWKLRYASGLAGTHRFRSECSVADDAGLHAVEGAVEVRPGVSENPLFRHGPVRVAADRRHFEHADGTPFFWLADTWWKCLSRRMSLSDFQELTADRRRKGFTTVQIVCGPYPDEDMMEARWANEGGLPYTTRDFREANPAYFAFAERRIRHLVDAGIVPVIVGGWGRPQGGGRSTLQQAGLEGFQRHWRHLIARFGALPVIWVVGGEARDEYGPWGELARHVQRVDPWRRPICFHSPAHPRHAIRDNAHFDFDMVGIGHMGFKTAAESLNLMRECLAAEPLRPVLCGEACYEAHMQTNFSDVQRHLFWSFLLSGAAGHTYGAAGVWQASVEGDPGITPVYDFTTWREGMSLPGSTQLGLGKALLEQYPWSRFEPHPEWTDATAFAAGIPSQVRVIYQPSRGIYKWDGVRVNGLEPGVPYRAFYFDPVSARRHALGTFLHADPAAPSPAGQSHHSVPADFTAPNVPSPQDWVLVLERLNP